MERIDYETYSELIGDEEDESGYKFHALMSHDVADALETYTPPTLIKGSLLDYYLED